MKRALSGIGVILFAILLQMCSNGMGLFTLGLGVIGLAVTITFAFKEEKS